MNILLKSIRYSYINILKHNRKGVNRFGYLDKYIATHNHPFIKTHLQYENNFV
jgi:hypothetical protein